MCHDRHHRRAATGQVAVNLSSSRQLHGAGARIWAFVPYTDFANTIPTGTSPNWVSNGFLYTTATSTNFIQTTKNGSPYTLTNVTYLATQSPLPLDDLGSYVVDRFVMVTDRSALEPASTNLNYKLITVSNTWTFLGRAMQPIVIQTIRDQP